MPKNRQHKTNAMRILDSHGISYKSASYEVDEADLSGTHVAELLGQTPEQVFKTLVLDDGHGDHIVCCIPSCCELDLKKAAIASRRKKVEMIPMKTLFDVTGYIRGGCSPIGMKREFETFVDETASIFDEIAVSAGVRGEQIIIAPDDLVAAAHATLADLTAI